MILLCNKRQTSSRFPSPLPQLRWSPSGSAHHQRPLQGLSEEPADHQGLHSMERSLQQSHWVPRSPASLLPCRSRLSKVPLRCPLLGVHCYSTPPKWLHRGVFNGEKKGLLEKTLSKVYLISLHLTTLMFEETNHSKKNFWSSCGEDRVLQPWPLWQYSSGICLHVGSKKKTNKEYVLQKLSVAFIISLNNLFIVCVRPSFMNLLPWLLGKSFW